MRFATSFAAMAWAWTAPVLAQDVPETETAAIDADVAALSAEIDAIAEGDPSADPEGNLVKLEDLRRRVDANGKVPAFARGILETNFGAAYFYLRDFDRALSYYDRAAELYIEGDAPLEDLAGLYNNQATILGSLARFDEAETYHLKALEIRRRIEGERGPTVASSMFGLGAIYYRQGRILEALDYLRPAVEQTREFLGPQDVQSILRQTSLASVQGRAGYEREAIVNAREAVKLAREHLGEEHPLFGIAVNNLGHALMEGGAIDEAVPVLREALRLRVATVGEDASGTAISLRNLSQALDLTGATEEAEALQRRAVEIYEKTGEVENPFALATMYGALADFSARRGEWGAFDALMEKAIVEADEALDEDSVEQAVIHIRRAEWGLRRGEIADALAEAERWVPVIREALDESHRDRIRGELLLARLRQLSGGAPENYEPIADAAMAVLTDRIAGVSVSDVALVREARSHTESAILLLEIGADAQDADRVIQAAQLANISSLSRGRQFAVLSGEDDAVAARQNVLELARRTQELRARYRSALDNDDREAADRFADEIASAERIEQAAADRLRTEFPEFVARMRPAPVSQAQLRAKLDVRDLLVVPVEGSMTTWIVRIARDDTNWNAIASGSLAADVAAIRRAVERPESMAFPYDASHRLFDTILPQGLDGRSRIMTYGGQALASLPLGLLTSAPFAGEMREAPWLLRRAAQQVVGNLALLGSTVYAGSRPDALSFVGVGGVALPESDSQASGGGGAVALFRGGVPDSGSIAALPALPEAARELRDIADAFSGTRKLLLIGPDAAEENFKRTPMDGVDIVVFATHGLVAGEIAGLWEPALLLGTGTADGSEDGLLGASEIARLAIDADWVVLSACNTAAGDGNRGPTYSGLATAFAQAGARSLMLSHWRVRDDAARYLTVATIGAAFDGTGRAEALRLAQLAMIADPSVTDGAHPAHWAPFVLIED